MYIVVLTIEVLLTVTPSLLFISPIRPPIYALEDVTFSPTCEPYTITLFTVVSPFARPIKAP